MTDEQRTDEWHAKRIGRVTGSMVGAILGLAPYMDRDDVMRSMVRAYHGAKPEFEGNVATEWGVANEAGAIKEYEMETGNTVRKCGFYTYEDWLGASPDGFAGENVLIEIKCPYGIRKDKKPEFKHIDDQQHYYAQMQIQMLCTDTDHCHFYQWTPHDTLLSYVMRDNNYLNEILPQLKSFWHEFLAEIERPEKHLEDKRIIVDTPRAKQMMAEYDDLCNAIDMATERKKELIEAMAEMAHYRNATFSGRALTHVQKDGAVSYASVVKKLLPDVNLEPYRGKPSSYWVVK